MPGTFRFAGQCRGRGWAWAVLEADAKAVVTAAVQAAMVMAAAAEEERVAAEMTVSGVRGTVGRVAEVSGVEGMAKEPRVAEASVEATTSLED